MGKFNLGIFHFHLGSLQITTLSCEKQGEESRSTRDGLQCQVEMLFYFSPYHSAS